MASRVPLPTALRDSAFRAADAAEHGIGRGRLRSPDVAHPFHGVNSVGLDLDHILERCRAAEPLLDHGRWFSHTTALALWGAPLPRSVVDIHVSVLFPRTPPRRRGVIGHALASIEPALRLGLPVVAPADAWCQAASILSREECVVVADFLLTGRKVGTHREPALVTLAELEIAADRHRGARGALRVAWALPRARVGPDSRPESLLRLLLVAHRIEEPTIGHPIEVEGGLVLHPDLALVRARVVLEYEGDGHRLDRRTWLADIARRELIESAGWRVVRVTSVDLFEQPRAFVERLRAILRSRSPR